MVTMYSLRKGDNSILGEFADDPHKGKWFTTLKSLLAYSLIAKSELKRDPVTYLAHMEEWKGQTLVKKYTKEKYQSGARLYRINDSSLIIVKHY